jgi:hypothetical protein
LFQKRIYSIFLGTLVGKRKQTIFKKRWFDITSYYVLAIQPSLYAAKQYTNLTDMKVKI